MTGKCYPTDLRVYHHLCVCVCVCVCTCACAKKKETIQIQVSLIPRCNTVFTICTKLYSKQWKANTDVRALKKVKHRGQQLKLKMACQKLQKQNIYFAHLLLDISYLHDDSHLDSVGGHPTFKTVAHDPLRET